MQVVAVAHLMAAALQEVQEVAQLAKVEEVVLVIMVLLALAVAVAVQEVRHHHTLLRVAAAVV
jgi:hypothetical protein